MKTTKQYMNRETDLVTEKLTPLPHRILLLAIEEDTKSPGGIIYTSNDNELVVGYTINDTIYYIPITLAVAKVIKIGADVDKRYHILLGKTVLVRTGDACDMIIARSPETGQEWFSLNPEQIEVIIE